MLMRHNELPGKVAIIEPCVDKYFPRHSAVLIIKYEGREAEFCRMLANQAEGIEYCRRYGYNVPFGF